MHQQHASCNDIKPTLPTLRIGLFGGTFDPIHQGHLALAELAYKTLKLDQVWFLPARHNPLKVNKPLLSEQDRLDLIAAAIADDPRYKLCDLELKRQGPSYFVDTIRQLAQTKPAQWILLLGADSWAQFTSWKDYRDILAYCDLAVFRRPGYEITSPETLFAVESFTSVWYDNGQDVRYWKLYFQSHNMRSCAMIYCVDTLNYAVSATEIRNYMKTNWPRAAGFLPVPVAQLIKERKLYGQS